jgi:hypothetical protein
VDDSSNFFVHHAVLRPRAFVLCVSARAARKRVCELHKLSFVRERERDPREDREGQDLWKNVVVVQQLRMRIVATM